MAKHESEREYGKHETPESEAKEGHSVAFLKKAEKMVAKKHGGKHGHGKRMEKK
jgi:hypothetical protein